MGLLGKSFQEKVNDALEQVRAQRLGITDLGATIAGKVVTLTGEAASPEAKGKAMEAFNALVETENTINQIRVVRPAAPVAVTHAAEAPVQVERWHLVVAGDTLSALAKKYLGSAGRYMEIFNANSDQLKDPNLIKIGQRLRIP